MILVDTSVWVDHLRFTDDTMSVLLETGKVLAHPFVTGELALGRIPNRDNVLDLLHRLPQSNVALDSEVLELISLHDLVGSGIGYVDVHLLAAVRLTPEATFWTRDQRLWRVADQLGIAQVLLR